MSCKTSEQDLELVMHIDNLAEFIFLRNKNNAEVYLQLNGIEDIKDLFFFCLDLFCKGLVLLYGEGNRVDLETMSMEKFIDIKHKMSLAGIDVQLTTHIPESDDITASTTINLQELDSQQGNLRLSDYCFTINSPSLIYNLKFDLLVQRKHLK